MYNDSSQNDGYQNNSYQYPPNQRKPRGSYDTIACVLAVLSLLVGLTMTFFPSIVLGSLAMILGLLSRGKQRSASRKAWFGVIVGCFMIVSNLVMGAYSTYALFQDPEALAAYHDSLNETSQQINGVTFDEVLKQYGIDPSIFGSSQAD